MKALRTKPRFNIYFRYKNIYLWKYVSISKLNKKKWTSLKLVLTKNQSTRYYKLHKGIYLCHYRKLNIERLYFNKFLNKQILRHYLVNYNETSFKNYLFKNFINFEKRLDYNLYKANFVQNLYVARFYITKGCVLVNGKRVTSVNYLLKTNDYIEVNYEFRNYIKKFLKTILYDNKLYIRNIEIDYKTISFIFLDQKAFYILNFSNFIKRIYYQNNLRIFTTNIFKTKRIYNIRNKLYINTYFKFFEYIYNYYLFFDKQNRILNYKKLKNLNDYNITLLSNFIKLYYNDYYFRNILLKRIFLMKYNYLNFMHNNSVFNNYYIFENIKTIFNNIYDKNNISEHSNQLLKDFFKYYFNIFFKFYIYLIKNYYINFLTISSSTSINNYKYLLLFNVKFFNLIKIKFALNNYYKHQYLDINSYKDIVKTNKYKILDYTLIPQQIRKKEKFVTKIYYHKLLYYVSSTRYKYYIYRYCSSFKQNTNKRKKIIIKSRRSFTFKFYNKLHFGIEPKLITKRRFFNYLINKTNLHYHSSIIFKKPVLLQQVNYKISTKDLNYNIIQLQEFLKNNMIKNSSQQSLSIEITDFINQLTERLKIISKNKSLQNRNYNKQIQNIYSLQNQFNVYRQSMSNDLNLIHTNYNILYKTHIRGVYLKHKYQSSHFNTNKYYQRYVLSHFKSKLNYFYINYNKPRSLLPTNLKKYFLSLTFKSNKSFIFYNLKKKNKKDFFSEYMFKINNNKPAKKKTNFTYSNMQIIMQDFTFNDNLFFVDLILNLSVRKLNSIYNKFNYKNIHQISSFYNNTVINFNNFKNIKSVPNSKYLKNNNKLYLYKIYTLKYFTSIQFNSEKKIKLFNFSLYSKIIKNNRNKIIYFYNFNEYINLSNTKFYKILFKNYNHKKFQTSKRLFIKLKKQIYFTNLYKIYMYYIINLKKYKIIKYVFMQYIFKEYDIFINKLLSTNHITTIIDQNYIKNLYYNLLFTKFINITCLNNYLKPNFTYSSNFKIIINYFTLIKRFYK